MNNFGFTFFANGAKKGEKSHFLISAEGIFAHFLRTFFAA